MRERFHTIEAAGIRLRLDLDVGHIRSLKVEHGGGTIEPLHTAPWIDEPEIIGDQTIPAGLKYLSGDFFCSPFVDSDIEEAPPHGWPANSRWNVMDSLRTGQYVIGRYELEKRVMGARLIKEIRLSDDHPFVYQRHVFEGGEGDVSAASHAMTRFADAGRLSYSPKQFADLPSVQQESDPERGRSLFAHPARFTDLTRLPLADSTTVDLHQYPVAQSHEDFVMLVEDTSNKLGWTAAVRDLNDIVLSLKNPADFPTTFLWFSNGGRNYPPWNSRHVGVLGIEEGRAYSVYGHAASVAPNPLSEMGIPTSVTLDPNGSVELRHVLGAVPLPDRWNAVTSVSIDDGRLNVTGDPGGTHSYPIDAHFLG